MNRKFLILLAIGACGMLVIDAIPDIVQPNSVECHETGITFKIDGSTYPLANVGSGSAMVVQKGSSCVLTNGNIANTAAAHANQSITIPAACINWTQIIGPDGSEAYSTTDQQLILNSTSGTTDIEYFFHVNCLVSKNVIINGGVNNTGGGGGNGGQGGTNTTNDVGIYITNAAGQNVSSVPESTPLILNIRLTPQQSEYNSIMPYYCYFSNGEKSSALYAIQNNCPNNQLLKNFQYLTKVQKVSNQYYQVFFNAFTYSQFAGQFNIQVTCDLLLCTNLTRCTNPCWSHPHVANHMVIPMNDAVAEYFSMAARQEQLQKSSTKFPEIATMKHTSFAVTKTLPTPSKSQLDETICLSKTTVYTMYAGLGFLSFLLLLLIPACCCLLCCGAGAIGISARRRSDDDHEHDHRHHRHHHRHQYHRDCPDCDTASNRYAASYSSRDGLANFDMNNWVSSSAASQHPSSSSAKSLPRAY